jgi:hypothetical protein
MRTLLAALAVAASIPALMLACSSNDSSGGTTDTGNGNPCEGLGCASLPGKLVVKVQDVTGAEVPSPTFTEKGAKLTPYCESSSDAGAGLCPMGWAFATLFEGPHTIDVTASGFDTQEFTASIQGPAGCCGIGPEVDQTVKLTPVNGGDAGDTGTDASDADGG